MRVTVDREKCCGAGRCFMLEPKVFDQGEDGLAVVKDPSPPPELHKVVREAATVCPGAAIRVEETP
jgi:ferredoxin